MQGGQKRILLGCFECRHCEAGWGGKSGKSRNRTIMPDMHLFLLHKLPLEDITHTEPLSMHYQAVPPQSPVDSRVVYRESRKIDSKFVSCSMFLHDFEPAFGLSNFTPCLGVRGSL